MSGDELKALAQDLIRASAKRFPSVGDEPLQSAVLRAGQPAVYKQPISSAAPIVLPVGGKWYQGVEFTLPFPFAEIGDNVVFTSCLVRQNQSPIPIDGNWFFGCEFIDAVFRYAGGTIGWGANNTLVGCELRIADSVELESAIALSEQFSVVTRELA